MLILSSNTGNSNDSDDSMPTDDIVHYKAVVCTGRQPDSDVFIFGPSLQFTSNGNEIAIDKAEYVWVPEILDKLVPRGVHPIFDLPHIVNPLNFVVSGLNQIAGENVISGVFLLGMYVVIIHTNVAIVYTINVFAYRGCHHQYAL